MALQPELDTKSLFRYFLQLFVARYRCSIDHVLESMINDVTRNNLVLYIYKFSCIKNSMIAMKENLEKFVKNLDIFWLAAEHL